MKMPDKIMVTVRLDADTLARIDQVVASRPEIETRSQCIRFMLNSALDKERLCGKEE